MNDLILQTFDIAEISASTKDFHARKTKFGEQFHQKE